MKPERPKCLPVLDEAAANPPISADRLSAALTWMGDAPLVAGRAFSLVLGAARVTATVTAIHTRLDSDRCEQIPSESLGCNDLGSVELSLAQPLLCATYEENPAIGRFQLLDRSGGAILATGLVEKAISSRSNLRWQTLDVTPEIRAGLKSQRPAVLWFTGLPASGKSTIANLVERRLAALGRHTMLLDGDNVRHGLNRDLGFSEADRVENIRRVAEVARLLADAGLIVLCAFISPYRDDRALARRIVGAARYVEVFVDTPVAECRRRDPKGHYAKAAAGLISNFTGVDAPYEPPSAPEMQVQTLDIAADDAAAWIVRYLQELSSGQ